ncbi:MAG: hypothetical protein JF593_12570, partial [Novosphingobium sp.]|nr:hypothetical protein [Novosphingobium sp.]
MHRTRRLVAMLLHLAVLLVAPALHAQALGSTRHIAASLVADGAGTPGGTVMLAFVMRPERGWHG